MYHISKKRPDYISTEVITLSKDRDYHHKMANHFPVGSDAANYHVRLATSLHKSVNTQIKNAKRQYILDKFESSQKTHQSFGIQYQF